MPRALITGITGQDGLYLAELLLGKGYEVFGLMRGQNNPKRSLVETTVPGVKILTGDLTDLSSLMRALQVSKPDEFYNLGAISFVADSWENARMTTEVTGTGVLNALEAVRLYSGDDISKVRFYQASSSEMFGKVQTVPQSESTLLWPRSPYGVAKVYGHYMTINYRESYGMHASSGILFNHESACRRTSFSETWTQNATGVSPAITSRPCGSCFSRMSRTTTSSPPVRPTRSRNCSPRPSLPSTSRTGSLSFCKTPSSCALQRSTCSSAMPQRLAKHSAGHRRSTSRPWSG
jgi:GDP-mannose 4,6-dehydratase